jgi:uncharacterized BrkB/YihY/UPF0761 family membrane protein
MSAGEQDQAEKKAAPAKKPGTKKAATTKPAPKKKAATTKPAPKKVSPAETRAPATIDTGTIEIDATVADAAPESSEPSRIARAKALAESVKARGLDEYEHLQERRETSKTIDSVFTAAEHDEEVGGGILAAAVAFRLFLFMVPLVFVLVVVFGIGADAAGESSRDLASSAGAVGLLAKSFASVAGGSLWERLVALVVGSFALFLTTRSALKVLRVTSGLVWDVPIPKLEHPTRATGIFLAVIIAALGLIQLIGVLDGVSLVAGIIATALFILVPAGLWVLFSLRAFPHAEEAGWKAMVPGSLLVGIGIQLLHLFTVLWIARLVDSKSETYGAIGVALALLFWAYLTGRIFMAGMVVNASQWYRSHDRPESEQQPEEMLDA